MSRVAASVVSKMRPSRNGNFKSLKSCAVAREHWVLEDREATRVDLRPNWLKSRVIELKTVDVRPDSDALHAKFVDAAIEFAERSFDIFQRQACQTNKPTWTPAAVTETNVV